MMTTLVPIFSGLVGGALALFGIWLKLYWDNARQQEKTSNILDAEWKDISRHFDRNVDRLRSMQSQLEQKERWPERVHIQKLKWPEDTFIFGDLSIEYSPAKTVSNIYKMRLRIRNANLDADAALRAFLTGDKQMFAEALLFVEGRHLRIENLALELQNRELKVASRNTEDMLFFDKPLLG